MRPGDPAHVRAKLGEPMKAEMLKSDGGELRDRMPAFVALTTDAMRMGVSLDRERQPHPMDFCVAISRKSANWRASFVKHSAGQNIYDGSN